MHTIISAARFDRSFCQVGLFCFEAISQTVIVCKIGVIVCEISNRVQNGYSCARFPFFTATRYRSLFACQAKSYSISKKPGRTLSPPRSCCISFQFPAIAIASCEYAYSARGFGVLFRQMPNQPNQPTEVFGSLQSTIILPSASKL